MLKCTVCNGQKKVNGMGNMREDCKACNGKGFISEAEPLKVKEAELKKAKGKFNDGERA